MNNSTPPFRIFPAVHENELSEKNKRKGRCSFSQFLPKKIRRRGSKKTSDLSTTVTTSTGQGDFENPSHQALQPRPILHALLVSLNFASIKNIFDSVFYSHFKLTDIWETVLFMRCDESHTMTVLIFLFLVIFFYIGLKLI